MDSMDNDFVGTCGGCGKTIEGYQAVAFTKSGIRHLLCKDK